MSWLRKAALRHVWAERQAWVEPMFDFLTTVTSIPLVNRSRGLLRPPLYRTSPEGRWSRIRIFRPDRFDARYHRTGLHEGPELGAGGRPLAARMRLDGVIEMASCGGESKVLQEQSDFIVSGGKIDFARQRGPEWSVEHPTHPKR